jgi:hypothetical protein
MKLNSESNLRTLADALKHVADETRKVQWLLAELVTTIDTVGRALRKLHDAGPTSGSLENHAENCNCERCR